MYLTPDINLQKQLKQWSKYLIMSLLLIASLVLLGWMLDINFLKRPLPRLVAMNPTSVFSFILSGISFLLLTSETRYKRQFSVAYALACIPIMIGTIRIAGLVLHFDFQVDQIFFR